MVVLNTMCNAHCSELDNKDSLADRAEVTLGGIVTGVKSKFTKSGKPCGFVTIEDFEGSGELAFFGEDWGRWRGMLTPGCSVFVSAKWQSRFGNSNYRELKVYDIQYLQTVKAKRIEKFTVTMKSSDIDDRFVNDLMTQVDENPGQTLLYFRIVDGENNSSVLLRSKTKTVEVTKRLINYIESMPGLSYKVN